MASHTTSSAAMLNEYRRQEDSNRDILQKTQKNSSADTSGQQDIIRSSAILREREDMQTPLDNALLSNLKSDEPEIAQTVPQSHESVERSPYLMDQQVPSSMRALTLQHRQENENILMNQVPYNAVSDSLKRTFSDRKPDQHSSRASKRISLKDLSSRDPASSQTSAVSPQVSDMKAQNMVEQTARDGVLIKSFDNQQLSTSSAGVVGI